MGVGGGKGSFMLQKPGVLDVPDDQLVLVSLHIV